MKNHEEQGVERLSTLLGNIIPLTLSPPRVGKPAADMGVDAVLLAEIDGKRFELLVEVKSTAQPRHVRPALLQLRHVAAQVGKAAVPVLVAPFLSDQSQALCREFEVGYLDFEGNAFLSFGSVFIERSVAGKPAAHQRELKSLYKPKAAQVLRELLDDPAREWLTTELADSAGVSLGHVSNVRTALLEREWARVTPRGFSLIAPDALLDDWRAFYDPRGERREAFYTAFHGDDLGNAIRAALRAANDSGLRLVLSSFSAAEWLSPYARAPVSSFYAEEAALPLLRQALKLTDVSRGENVVVTIPRDEGVFRGAVFPAADVACTSALQTYLDLASSGERGREAAEFLRKQKLKW
ncbi:MAG: type IV toxin-antitoxin system AbiEi family antitoxin [Gammaproteobacteria bacterium]